MLLLLPMVIAARAWEPIHHGGHAHQIVEVTGLTMAGVGVGLFVAAPIVLAADPPCTDREACALQTALDLGLTGIVVTAAGMVTMTVGRAIRCPAVKHDFVLVATPRGVALTTQF